MDLRSWESRTTAESRTMHQTIGPEQLLHPVVLLYLCLSPEDMHKGADFGWQVQLMGVFSRKITWSTEAANQSTVHYSRDRSILAKEKCYWFNVYQFSKCCGPFQSPRLCSYTHPFLLITLLWVCVGSQPPCFGCQSLARPSHAEVFLGN